MAEEDDQQYDEEPVEDEEGDDSSQAHRDRPSKGAFSRAPADAPCNVPNFSFGPDSKLPKDKLMSSEGIIPLQNGTNKFASQKGQTGFGVPRDVVDKIKSPNLREIDGDELARTKEVIPLQMGTNKFASQKGQTGFGASRDVLYKPKFLSTEEPVPEEKQRMSDGIIPLQMGTNKLASQKGMTGMGSPRPVYARNHMEQDADSQGFIGRQMDTYHYASQAGMTGFGMPRSNLTKYKDTERGEIENDESVLPRQNISSYGKANQSGTSGFGAFRNTTAPLGPHQDRSSQGFIPYQMGINWADSQAGKTAFGMPRLTATEAVDDTREPLPEDLARDPNTPMWSSGYQYGATQSGMTGMGMPRDVKGSYLRRLW